MERVYFRHYAVKFLASGSKIPKVALEEIGPRLNMSVRRSKSAEDDVKKESLRQPKVRKSQKKMKNIERGVLGAKMGRVHMQKQDTGTMALRKFKGLRKEKGAKRKQSSTKERAGKRQRDTHQE